MNQTIMPMNCPLKGEITVPGDKSISHRAVMFGAISEGTTEITGFLNGDDCISTINCFKKLGIEIKEESDKIIVFGKGLYGLQAPKEVLDAGNSGTTTRLLSGILSGQAFFSEITGDSSIQNRPMNRIIVPLTEMGASIKGKKREGYAPLLIKGQDLHGITYEMPVASAQVKSAIILASLYADSPTKIIEPAASRNHTEIMLNYFGADIKSKDNIIVSNPIKQLYARAIEVPGDISSAAFFIVAALIVPDSHLIIRNVGINSTRKGIVDALIEMGGNISVINTRFNNGEPIADIEVKYSELHAIELAGDIIPKMIDEIPIFSVAALFADGETIIKNAEELKVKESNRIAVMTNELNKMGADITETDDGMIIKGSNKKLNGALIDSHKDHRVAMSIAVASLLSENETKILDSECVNISYPGFFTQLCEFYK